MDTKRLTAKIYGRVQGVGFRYAAHEKGKSLDLKVVARNEPDGSVYVEAEGKEENLKKLLEWCHKGPWSAKVERAEGKFSDA